MAIGGFSHTLLAGEIFLDGCGDCSKLFLVVIQGSPTSQFAVVYLFGVVQAFYFKRWCSRLLAGHHDARNSFLQCVLHLLQPLGKSSSIANDNVDAFGVYEEHGSAVHRSQLPHEQKKKLRE